VGHVHWKLLSERKGGPFFVPRGLSLRKGAVKKDAKWVNFFQWILNPSQRVVLWWYVLWAAMLSRDKKKNWSLAGNLGNGPRREPFPYTPGKGAKRFH